jgi:hypothetical protein
MKISKTGYKKNSKDKNEPALVIPSNKITMKDVDFPVYGTDDTGYSQMMYPGLDYSFPGSYVYELPMAQDGGYMLPGRFKNPEGNWVSKYANGGPGDSKRVTTNANQYTSNDRNVFQESSVIQNPNNIQDAIKMYTRSVNVPGKEEKFMEYFQTPDSSSFKYNHPFFGQHEIVTRNPLLKKLGDKYFSSKFDMGGDISIPDLSKSKWLDKYQDGGPKPMSWQEYLKYMGADDAELKSINPKDYLLWEEDQHTLLKDLDPEKAKTAKAAKINFYDKSARHIPHESNLLKDVYASRKADLIDTYNLLYFNNDKQDYSGSPGNVTKWENGEDVFYPGKFAIENEGDESLTAQEILNRTKTNYSLPIQDYASQRMKKRPNYADTKIPYTRVYPRTMLMDYNNPSADFNAGIEYINDPRYVDVTENFYSDPPSARPMSFFPAPSYNYANAPKRYDEKGNEVINKSDVPKIKPNTYYDFPGSNTEMIYNEKLRLNNITKENIRNIKTIDPTGNIGDIDYNTPAAKKYINDPWFYYGKERNDGDPYCVNCDKLSGSEHSQDKLFDYFKFAPQSPSSNLWWMKTFGLKPPRPVFLNQNLTKSGQVQIGWDVWDPKRKQWKAEYFDSDEINKRREDVKVPKDGGQDVNFRTGVIHDLTPVNKDKEAAPVKKKIEVPPGMKTGGWLDRYQDGREVSSKYDLMRVDQPTAVAASTNVVVPNIVKAPKIVEEVKQEAQRVKKAMKETGAKSPAEAYQKEKQLAKMQQVAANQKSTLSVGPDKGVDYTEDPSDYPPENYSKIIQKPGVSGSTMTVFVDPKTGEEWIPPGTQAVQEAYSNLSRSNNVDLIGTAILAGSLGAPLVKAALPYLNAPAVLPYFGEVPWLTAGNVLGAGFASDAMVNRLPEIPGQISRGEYADAATNALTGVLDLYGANMISPLFRSAKSAAVEAGKYFTKQLPGSPNFVNEIPKRLKIKPPMLNTSQEPYSKTYPELSPRYKIEKSNFDTESVFWTDYNKREHGIDYDRPIPRFYDPTVHPPEFHPSVMKYEKPWTPEELEEIAAKKAAAQRIKSHLKTVPFEQRRFDTQSRITPTSSLPGSPNAPIVNNASTTPVSWSIKDLPGLHLKSTLSDGPISKIVEPKTGLINVDQALAIIGKESGGVDKVAIIKQGLGETMPKKMDYNEFRKVVQDQLIPLERQFAEHSSNYGLGAIGYPSPKRSSFEMAAKNIDLEIIDINKQIEKTSSSIKTHYGQGINGEHIYSYESKYGTQYYPTKEGALAGQKRELNDLNESLNNRISHKETNVSKMRELPLENQTLILSNKSKFGRGAGAHGNPDETLGHIHFLRDAETPDVLTVTQIQSDAFQGTHRIMPKDSKNLTALEKQQKSLERMEELQERNKAILNKMKTEGVDEAGAPVQDYQIKQFEDLVEAQEKSNLFKKTEIENFSQKSLLDKNHQERYLQELVGYAAERGDVNKVRVPTSETAAKVQGYAPVSELNKSEEFINLRKNIVEALEAHGNNSQQYKKANEIYENAVKNSKKGYSSEHQTILKKYSELPKTIKKLFGAEPKVVTDSKGNSWYEFDIPENFKQGKGEIKAYRYGGWLDKYQNGGSKDMPLGLPLREQNPYLVPEYNQPIANGYILPDPNRPQLMNTGATEYKYSYGVDDRDVQVPSVVAGQYIGDNAFDRYMISGEEFKPMADPGSYSKFYDMIEKLGLMKQKKGGVKSQGEGYYDYINGYSGIFANGGTKSKENSWLNKYK